MFTLYSKGKKKEIIKPLVMGVVNCTDDSFYEASRSTSFPLLKQKIDDFLSLGTDIVDIGGRSSRPGSVEISEEEEIKRISDVLDYLAKQYPEQWISIDTTSSVVAKFAIERGAHIVNDISAGELDTEMISTVSTLEVPFICMHMQGKPETMQMNPVYVNVVDEVVSFFEKKLEECKLAGIKQLIIDPGLGFGKTIGHNYELVKHLSKFNTFNMPILVGFSRKSMIYKLLNTTPEKALNGTTVLNTFAIINGASILRVHDVKEANEVVAIVEAIKNS